MCGVTGYALLTLAILFTVIGFSWGGVPVWNIIGVTTTTAVFVAGMATPLLLCRQVGFRLRWGRESSRPAEHAGAGDTNSLLGAAS